MNIIDPQEQESMMGPMKKRISVLILVCLFFTGCQNQRTDKNWGSFTAGKTYSYDQKYYAVQSAKESEGISFIDVVIYNEQNEPVYTFTPARASDFWGICWEKDTYNIWIQSADIGVICYAYDHETWIENRIAVCPDYIISKYN